MSWNSVLPFAAALLCAVVASMALAVDRRSMLHRLLAGAVMLLAATQVFAGLTAAAAFRSDMMSWLRWRMLVEALVLPAWLVFSLTFGRTNHREVVRAWRPVLVSAAVLPIGVAGVFGSSFFAIPPQWGEFLATRVPLGWAGSAFELLVLVVSVVVLMNLEGTLRATAGSKRWRIKFMVLAVGSWAAVQLYLSSQALLFASLDLSLDPLNALAVAATAIFASVALSRNRWLVGDLYLSPSLVTNSMVLVLVGAYLVAVGALAFEIDELGGSENFALAAFFVFVALLALAVALFSDQLRLALRRFVVHNLARPRYDYRKEWMTFTQRTASVVEVRELCGAVAKMTGDTFGVPAVTIWLADEGGRGATFGGSTVIAETELRDQPEVLEAAHELVKAVSSRPSSVLDLEVVLGSDPESLAAARAKLVGATQARYAVALVATRRVLGAMTVSARRSGEEFSLEDFDLLRTIADQAAGALLNLELSHRLVNAKQMEAFQTLSTFFIHDLKNLSSMLSLTVQNLPANFDDPGFRADALRVIGQSVEKMNAMCGNLSALTRELELHETDVDLNELVTHTLRMLDGALPATVESDLRPIRRVRADAELIEKVVVNLLLNAGEATGAGGSIRVATEERSDLAILTVADDGCGMSAEFMERSLFHPFQTTKSKGLGIGLFQSRRIVEAHHGAIRVGSEPGKGTTFRVELPLR